MDVSAMIPQMILLFLIMLVGFFIYKIKLVNQQFNRQLSTFLLNVTFPCMILHSALEQTGERDYRETALVFACAIAMYAFLMIAAFLSVKLLHYQKPVQRTYQFLFLFSNVGFMGFPVVEAAYGSEALFYTAIFNLIFNLLCFSYGIFLMGGEKGNGGGISVKQLINPAVISSVLALAVYFSGISLPSVLDNTLSTLGGVTSPLAMIVVGTTLGSMSLRDLLGSWRDYLFLVLRQIAAPLLFCFPMKLLVDNPYVVGITCILLCMPAANTGVLLANKYGRDGAPMVRMVFWTTLVSFITAPLVIGILW